MSLHTVEILPILLRTTGLLALSVLAVRVVLGRLRPASPALYRAAYALALFQGILIVRLSVPLPWGGGMMGAPPAPSSPSRDAPPEIPDRTPPTTSPAERPRDAGPSTHVAALPARHDGSTTIHRAVANWPGLIVAGWLAGMAGLLAILLVGYVRFVIGLRTRPPDEAVWAEEWSSLLSERGIRRPIPLRVADHLGPMLCCIPGGYRLIVPEWLWRRLDASERLAILKHELAHYTRGDLWKSLAVRALALPHWFNPFAWWTVQTFDECGEWACDDLATGGSGTSSSAAYARALLHLVEAGTRAPSFGFSARGSSLSTRLRRLLQPRPASDPLRTRLIVIGLTIGLLAFHLVRPELGARPPRSDEPKANRLDLYGDPLPPGALARLGTVRFRPGDRVEQLAYAPDGKTLACWDSSNTLSLFEAATGKPIRRYNLAHSWIHVMTYMPSGKSLAVIGSHENVTHLWDFAAAGEPAPEISPGPASGRFVREVMTGDDRETFGGFVVSSDGKLLAGGSGGFGDRDRMIRLWDVVTGKRLDELKPRRDFERRPGHILWIAFSPDGRTLLSLNGDPGNRRETFNKGGKGVLYTWDVARGAEVRHFEIPLPSQQGNRRALAVSPDGRILAVGAPTKPIHLFRLADGAELLRIDGLEGRVHTLEFSPDGTRLLSGGEDQAARIWDVATGRTIGEPIKHRSWVEAIAVAPGGRVAASGGADYLIRIWDPNTSRELVQIPAHEFWLHGIAMSPDGATAITSAWHDATRIWDAATGRQRRLIGDPDGAGTIALSPDGHVLAVTAGRPQEVRLYDADSGRELRRLHGHTRGIFQSIAFSRDGSRLVAAGGEDQTVRLWNVATGESLRLFKHPESVRAAAISPDGTIVAGAGFENRVRAAGRVVRIWDTNTGREIRQLRGHKEWANALAFSPDGKQLATGGMSIRGEGMGPGNRALGSPNLSDSVHLWDVATGTDLRQFPGAATHPSGRDRMVNALTFTPDGRTLITGEEDGKIVLYDAATTGVRATLRGHLNSVHAVSVSSDGRKLGSASEDLTALVWDLEKALSAGGGK